MNTNVLKLAVSAAAFAAVAAGSAGAETWQPDRPINIIVPWSAGGSTDQVTRVVAPILEEALGTEVVVVNQPGASGSIGTKAALDAPRDGYTWTANAIANNATYAVSGLLDSSNIDDYRIYLHVANAPLISVNANAPYEDFGALLDAMKTGDVTVSTAGVTSSGGTAYSTIKDALDGEMTARMVAYDGGNPAVIAAASGEVDMTTQLAVEQTEMIKAGRLRPLAVLSDTALEIEGLDPIPPITEWLDIDVAPDYFGVFIPAGAPQEVYDTVDAVWADKVMNADALKHYANQRGAMFAPSFGDEARARAVPVATMEACAMKERGEAVKDPSEVGLTCK
ncbi:UNVERIFIED_ORG: tripartite-type tricarboxylate transporter receptor subunit TctC [Martelella mediterranea]